MPILSFLKEKIESLPGDRALHFWPLMVLGFIVTCQQAWVPGFFHDGYLYAAFGKNAALYGHWLVPHLSHSTYAEFYQHIPFVFMLEGFFFKIFGASFLTARLFAAFFTLLTLWGLYSFLKEMKEEKWAYFAAALFIIIPPLMKKTRFPNLDIPLMTFIFFSLVNYYRALLSGKTLYWLLCGLFFGFSLLTKGPLGFFVPLIIIGHCVIRNNFDVLSRKEAWFGFLFGIVIFLIWPLVLAMNGKLGIFTDWYQVTFVDTIFKGRGQVENDYTVYFLFLLKKTNIWFLLTVCGTIQFFARRRNDLLLGFGVVWFWTVLVFLSLAKFKYSNYLMPLYPAMGIVGGSFLRFTSETFLKYFSSFFRGATVVLGLVLLIFPITTKSKRDVEITHSLEVLKRAGVTPTAWGIVNESYPFFNAANYLGFVSHAEVYDMHFNALEAWLLDKPMEKHTKLDVDENLSLHSWVFLAPRKAVYALESQFQLLFNRKLVKYIYFKRMDLYLLVPKEFLSNRARLVF